MKKSKSLNAARGQVIGIRLAPAYLDMLEAICAVFHFNRQAAFRKLVFDGYQEHVKASRRETSLRHEALDAIEARERESDAKAQERWEVKDSTDKSRRLKGKHAFPGGKKEGALAERESSPSALPKAAADRIGARPDRRAHAKR